MDQDILQQAIQLYESGLTIKQVAEKLGHKKDTVAYWLRSRGAALRPRSAFVLTDEKTEKSLELLAQGLSMAEVARQVGVSAPVIQRLAEQHNIDRSKNPVQIYAKDITAKFAAGVMAKDLAVEYNTTTATIYSCMDRAGVDAASLGKLARPARTQEEAYRAAADSIKRRRATDPAVDEMYHQKQKRAYQAKLDKYAPVMAKFHANGCVKCGEKRVKALDAHHRDPEEKMFNIGHRTAMSVTPEILEAELAKCDCLCANCHRKHHQEAGDSFADGTSQSKTALQVVDARTRLAPIFDEFRKNGCQICGFNSPGCLSAHHADPSTKEFLPSRAVTERMHNEVLEAELDKCVCLCETCHRLVHAGDIECPAPKV